MYIIGLTGSIASGKSTVSRILSECGAPIIDADLIARAVAERGEEGWRGIVAAFGEGVLLEDGQLDRAKVGEMIFRDEKKRALLDSIMHPIILNRIEAELDRLRMKGEAIAILDIPLLLELGWQDRVSAVWLVAVSPEVQKARLMLRNQLTEQQAEARIASQMSIEAKRQYADVIIENDGTLAETERDVKVKWNELKRVIHG
ncbi:MAG: dephospho-CoA kinase [Selenomonadales bacterium]|nr:dephospho-CoA kinase [Selenomonadales bacterium]